LRRGLPPRGREALVAETYEIYALNQAGRTVDWSSRLYAYPPGETTRSAYFLWVLHGPAGPIVVDTGFDPRQAALQRVALDNLRAREELLAAVGVDQTAVATVVLTHLHWDHFDVEETFPAATFWLQRSELEFWTEYGSQERWHRRELTDCFADDVAALKSSGRLRVVDGKARVADGVALEWIGGHTPGLQIVIVNSARGPFVLANDALTTYRNLRDWLPPVSHLNSTRECLDGMTRIQTLAGGDESRICPGHDDEIRTRFPQVVPGVYRLA
jgi:glyoxylase-like metal-dependent hydrolase (beta-lactamase superfamily II)